MSFDDQKIGLLEGETNDPTKSKQEEDEVYPKPSLAFSAEQDLIAIVPYDDFKAMEEEVEEAKRKESTRSGVLAQQDTNQSGTNERKLSLEIGPSTHTEPHVENISAPSVQTDPTALETIGGPSIQTEINKATESQPNGETQAGSNSTEETIVSSTDPGSTVGTSSNKPLKRPGLTRTQMLRQQQTNPKQPKGNVRFSRSVTSSPEPPRKRQVLNEATPPAKEMKSGLLDRFLKEAQKSEQTSPRQMNIPKISSISSTPDISPRMTRSQMLRENASKDRSPSQERRPQQKVGFSPKMQRKEFGQNQPKHSLTPRPTELSMSNRRDNFAPSPTQEAIKEIENVTKDMDISPRPSDAPKTGMIGMALSNSREDVNKLLKEIENDIKDIDKPSVSPRNGGGGMIGSILYKNNNNQPPTSPRQGSGENKLPFVPKSRESSGEEQKRTIGSKSEKKDSKDSKQDFHIKESAVVERKEIKRDSNTKDSSPMVERKMVTRDSHTKESPAIERKVVTRDTHVVPMRKEITRDSHTKESPSIERKDIINRPKVEAKNIPKTEPKQDVEIKSKPSIIQKPLIQKIDHIKSQVSPGESKKVQEPINPIPQPTDRKASIGQNDINGTVTRKSSIISEKDKTDTGESKFDISFRMLKYAGKGEWSSVDNMLRYTPKNKIDLSLMDDQGFTIFLLAVKDGRLVTLEKLFEIGVSINQTTKDGRNAAHVAAMYGKDETMRYIANRRIELLAKPAGPKAQLPLHLACSRPSGVVLTMVQLLLRSTSVPDKDSRLVEDKNLCIPLHLAAENGNIVVCKELLAHLGEKQVRAVRKDTGDTPLHLACKHRNLELVKMMVDKGATANIQNKDDRTPLHMVAEVGDETLLRVMYQLKADANLADKDDKTPLHVAAENGHTSVVEILIDKFKASLMARTKDGSTLMHIASMNGHTQTALAFLKRGVPLHMPNKQGALGLHSAAAMGHVPMVKTLLSKGTNVDIKTKDNHTALHVAVQSGKPDVVETLLGEGADVHVKGGTQGETPLHIASGLTGSQAKYCAEMLLKSGAEVNVKLTNGETALHTAARNGQSEMVELLLSEGADPTVSSAAGMSALHVAVRNCNFKVAQRMLKFVEEHRSKETVLSFVNQRTKEGLTPLHYAAEIKKSSLHYNKEDAQITNLLIDAGGNVNITTQTTGESVLHYCTRSGNEDVLLTIVNKIGPGAVQIALNKQSKGGWSPLLEACSRGHKGVIETLLKHHARIDVFDESGKTGLHLSAENGHVEVADVLLKNKAFVNSKSKSGEAPLHLAAMRGHTKMVQLLVQQYEASLEAVTLENQTPLHFAAKCGQLPVSSSLLAMHANANARDNKGQTPLHLAAENDFPEVVKLFLKMKQSNRNVLTAVDENGFTCAHIAAMKGSVAVVKELMGIDKAMVIEAKTKTTESTALHMAAAGGHRHIVKLLVENGADKEDENLHGMTALHMAAKNGHPQILEVFDISFWRRCSKKTGLNPLHVAAYYGQVEFVREMFVHVPAAARSEPPGSFNPLIVKELNTEYGFTPLHMAAQSGHDGLVRMLLNVQGVQVDATSTTMNVISLHLAAQSGHIAVVGMLLSRSTQQLHVKDSKGRTALHLAAMNGHYDMVSLLIAQGSNINSMDQNGWTGMHFSTKAGHLNVLQLFMQSSADPQAETKEGKIPLCFAASYNHNNCLSYLLAHDHDTHALMEDRRYIFDLMICGKNHNNRPLEEFILRSPAPIDSAVKLSSLYKDMSEKEKERARDLSNVAVFCENMAVELLSISATEFNPALLLKAHDQRGRPFLDVLIENEQKEVVSHASVQRYLTEIWSGGIDWGSGKFTAFFLLLLACPPAWIFFSLPFSNLKICRAPFIKFICHLISHVYFTVLLVLVVLNIVQKIYHVESIFPHPVEWLLWFWLSGILVQELSTMGGRSGLAMVRIIILFLSAIAIALHVVAFLYEWVVSQPGQGVRDRRTILYLKNQFFAFVLLFSFVQYLEFLTVHHLFGPWAIIIRDLMYDLTRFLVILTLFVAGFTLHVTSIFQPAYREQDPEDEVLMRLARPDYTLEMLFFALFGLVEPDNMPPLHLVPGFSQVILKLVFGIYMMVTLIVLINLLIAMMSDTYQRIQAQADTEWKFGRAMLIRQMNKKAATPAPINLFTKLYTFLRVALRNKLNMCTMKAQEDLRFEENIDAYSMSGGRSTPAMKMMAETEEGTMMPEVAELGNSSEWKIETVIPWSRVVELFYKYQGATLDDLKSNSTETTSLNAENGGGTGTNNSRKASQITLEFNKE